MKIYCAHQISGSTPEVVISYYDNIKELLTKFGYTVLHPMTGKGYFRTDPKEKFVPIDSKGPLSSNHAIFERDKWMVSQCDILYLDLSGCDKISIGCTMELAWAALLGKHTIVVLDNDYHRHAFYSEAADLIFENTTEALAYLEKLSLQRI